MRLLFGDCLDVLAEVETESVDMVLCDLPYGISRNSWDVRIDLSRLWSHYNRVTKRTSAVVLTSVQPFTTELVLSNPNYFRYSLVWHKTCPTGFLNARKMPMRAHEDILVFYRQLGIYNPQKTNGHPRKVSTAAHGRNSARSKNYGAYGPHNYDSTERYPTSVLTFSHDRQKSSVHSTQKPVALFEYLIRTYSNEGDVVLDSCMGAGSTGLACLNANREFVGVEKNWDMFCAAEKRLNVLSC